MTKFICINLIKETFLVPPYFEFEMITQDYSKDLFYLYFKGDLIFTTNISNLDSFEVFDTEQEALDFTDVDN